MTPEKDYPYIGKTIFGNRYNAKYPPNERRYGPSYGGYPCNAREVLLYYFAVQGYDVEFKYNGKAYHLLYEPDYAALCDSSYSIEYEKFANPLELIENLRIDGHRLIDIIDDLQDVEPE